MVSPLPRRATALLLIAGFLALASPGSVAAEATSFSGRVLGPGGADPRAGVVVTLADRASDRTYTSRPTDAKGAFTVDTAPAGRYAVLVETQEGAFLASSEVTLAPGVHRPVSLSLRPGKQGAPPAPTPPPTGTAPAKSGLPTWEKWVIAGGIVIGAAIVVDAVTSDNNEASQF
ncbi:MAG TPA: carboxypeptidase-like regulatory domain-containing protein [Candidatus Polarisedimenticolaceae bacterium]|nr:carboxypeptidase-like regulatory domain-containing protein [Candidatus Polarisedimenticolaceae bacterium]